MALELRRRRNLDIRLPGAARPCIAEASAVRVTERLLPSLTLLLRSARPFLCEHSLRSRPKSVNISHQVLQWVSSATTATRMGAARLSFTARIERARSTQLIHPSLLVLSQGWGLIDLPLRASNEGSPRPRVARAQKIIRLHPLLCSGSTGPTWVPFLSFSPCAFCEQEGRPGCCLSSPIQTAVM